MALAKELEQSNSSMDPRVEAAALAAAEDFLGSVQPKLKMPRQGEFAWALNALRWLGEDRQRTLFWRMVRELHARDPGAPVALARLIASTPKADPDLAAEACRLALAHDGPPPGEPIGIEAERDPAFVAFVTMRGVLRGAVLNAAREAQIGYMAGVPEAETAAELELISNARKLTDLEELFRKQRAERAGSPSKAPSSPAPVPTPLPEPTPASGAEAPRPSEPAVAAAAPGPRYLRQPGNVDLDFTDGLFGRLTLTVALFWAPAVFLWIRAMELLTGREVLGYWWPLVVSGHPDFLARPALVLLALVAGARVLLHLRQPMPSRLSWDAEALTERVGDEIRATIPWSEARRTLVQVYSGTQGRRRLAGSIVQITAPDGRSITAQNAWRAPSWLDRRRTSVQNLGPLLDASAGLPGGGPIEPDLEARRRQASRLYDLASVVGFGCSMGGLLLTASGPWPSDFEAIVGLLSAGALALLIRATRPLREWLEVRRELAGAVAPRPSLVALQRATLAEAAVRALAAIALLAPIPMLP